MHRTREQAESGVFKLAQGTMVKVIFSKHEHEAYKRAWELVIALLRSLQMVGTQSFPIPMQCSQEDSKSVWLALWRFQQTRCRRLPCWYVTYGPRVCL